MSHWGPPEVADSAFGSHEIEKGIGSFGRGLGSFGRKAKTATTPAANEPPVASAVRQVGAGGSSSAGLSIRPGKPGTEIMRRSNTTIVAPAKPAAAKKKKRKSRGWSTGAKVGAGVGAAGLGAGGGYLAGRS